MNRRQLLTVLYIFVAPLLMWGASRLVPAEAARVADAEAAGRASPALRKPSDLEGVDLPPDVVKLLREGRNWRAARRLRELVRPDSEPALVLVAAKAEAGWGGWANVPGLLEGKPWLDTPRGADGWYLLGRAREEAGNWPGAADAYRRYLAATPDSAANGERAVGELRHALAVLRTGGVDEGVRALDHLRAHGPAVSGWASVLAAEAIAGRGDTARVRRLLADERDPGSPLRAQRARIASYRAAGDPRGALALARQFEARATADDQRAALGVEAARTALALPDTAAARAELRAVLTRAPATLAAVDAARVLTNLGGLTAADQLAVAAVYDRNGNAERAAAGYAAWLGSGQGTPDARRDARLKLGRALFAAGKYAEVEGALRPLLEGSPPDVGAEAMLYIGRARFRRGDRVAAVAAWEEAARRFPGAPAAGDGLFYAADAAQDAGDVTRARALYRRAAAEFPRGARAGEGLMRVGAAAFTARDYAGAAAVYDDYRARFPTGSAWLQASYWAGRAHAAAGNAEAARQRWREVRAREALSYYSVKAAERLGERFWPVPLEAAPADAPADVDRVAGWMRTLDLLRAAGLDDEAEQEVERRIREAAANRGALYLLAEALNERGYTSQGTRMGRELYAGGEKYNPRLVRILYPFPYRDMVAAEARERGLDPFLVAALIRQESSFKAKAQSRVGARGLMQVMPSTATGLASGAGIRGWRTELLFVPEINVHLGTRFLAAQVRRYDGDLPNVFVAYNAGPGRVERWRSFPEARDRELFTERIPFDETRDYVKIVTRNMAIYRGLYGP